jgi:hypothetical protein
MAAGQSGNVRSIFPVDKALADNQIRTATEGLKLVRQRSDEFGVVWDEDTQGQFKRMLGGWLDANLRFNSRLRTEGAGVPADVALTPPVVEAQRFSLRQVELALNGWVLLQNMRQQSAVDMLASPRYERARMYWAETKQALDETPPRNADAVIKAMLALESLAQIATGAPRKTLGSCLTTLKTKADDAGRHLLGSIESVWNFSNTAPVRHAGGGGPPR